MQWQVQGNMAAQDIEPGGATGLLQHMLGDLSPAAGTAHSLSICKPSGLLP